MGIIIKENLQNKNMHNTPYTTGILSAPDSHYVPVLYSHYQATQEFNQIHKDIYTSSKHTKKFDRKKMPLLAGIILALGGTFGLLKLIKHFVKK